MRRRDFVLGVVGLAAAERSGRSLSKLKASKVTPKRTRSEALMSRLAAVIPFRCCGVWAQTQIEIKPSFGTSRFPAEMWR
jgi:hypothetical protein